MVLIGESLEDEARHYLEMIDASRGLIEALERKKTEFPHLSEELDEDIETEQATIEYYQKQL